MNNTNNMINKSINIASNSTINIKESKLNINNLNKENTTNNEFKSFNIQSSRSLSQNRMGNITNKIQVNNNLNNAVNNNIQNNQSSNY